MAQVKITEAPEARHIGRKLVLEHHKHLKDAKILYLFTSANRRKNDRVVLGTAQKLSGVPKFLSQGDEGEEQDAADIERHGLWRPDLERMGEVVQQLKLPMGG